MGTVPLRAAASFAAGLPAAAAGDFAGACRLQEDAGDLFERSPAPFEAARVRIELARVLRALGRDAVGAPEAATAQEALQRLGAAWEAGRAAALLREIGAIPAAGADAAPRSAGLTPCEMEVLRLLAAGLSNQEIAQQLVLSVRTVERHGANLYAKIGAHRRADAVAYAFRYRLVEPAPLPRSRASTVARPRLLYIVAAPSRRPKYAYLRMAVILQWARLPLSSGSPDTR